MAKKNAKKPTKVEVRKGRKSSPGALFIPAGLLAGMGVGFMFGNIPAGLFMGLGIGMAIFAIVELIKR